MSLLWGYSDLATLLSKVPEVKNGVVVDTNILISATYDFDTFFDQTNDLLSLLATNNIPLYCNVNVRAEFLEIHRRIIFTEALLSLEAAVTLSSLPLELSKKLASLRSNQNKREKDGRDPVRLSEADIKGYKLLMIGVQGTKGNLWDTFCADYVGDSLSKTWDVLVEDIGLNFLSMRQEDQDNHLITTPEWEKAVELMSKQGVSSSDAMILNIFLSSKFAAILSSDTDIGIAISSVNRSDKVCLLPDSVVAKLK